MKMSNFSLDIRWWVFGIITIGQLLISDCAKHKKTYGLFVNENSDRVLEPVTTHDDNNNDRTSTEIGCPLKCLCLGDLADCSKNDLDNLPRIPSWAKEL